VSRVALDTSVIVAALLEWHADNERASRAVGAALHGSEACLIPVGALLQAFSVMTRLPRGHRISPADALDRLRENFAKRARLVGRPPEATWELLARSVAQGVAGGGIHDGEILECAERAGATRLLTLNPQDFERLGPCPVEIVAP
jgi:predicted nucleic acid-binding protein